MGGGGGRAIMGKVGGTIIYWRTIIYWVAIMRKTPKESG